MATAGTKEQVFAWEGKDKTGKTVRGEIRAGGEAVVNVTLRRQGIMVTKVKKKVYRSGKKIKEKDITLFTRQLATMMKAGVPLLQAFDIVGKGHANPAVSKLVLDLRAEFETGIGPLWDRDDLPEPLADYVQLIKDLNQIGRASCRERV